MMSFLVSLFIGISAAYPLYPHFYDVEITVDDHTKMEEVHFRYLTGASYRAYGSNRSWCYESRTLSSGQPREIGRKYLLSDFIGFSVTMIDIILLLQFNIDNTECDQVLIDYRDYLLYDLPSVTDREWYENTYYPMTLEAFSCGFNATDELTQYQQQKSEHSSFNLPFDIRKDYKSSETLQKSWRLIKDFSTSTQKQREYPRRREDYDISLYLPFIGPYVNSKIGSRYVLDAHMRVGYPEYIGNSMWFVYHSWSQRIYNLQYIHNLDDEYVTEILNRFRNFLSFAVQMHPCPYCREHFLSSVSKNDIYWRDVQLLHGDDDGSDHVEAYRYPLEWLYIMGEDYNKDVTDLSAKLDVITSGKDLVLFFWKLHNAVSSSVDNRELCIMEETYDIDIYRCNQSAIPWVARQWPFSRKFEFGLNQGVQKWNQLRNNTDIKEAITRLYELDSDNPELRNYWKNYLASDETPDDIDPTVLQEVLDEIESLDEAMINSGIFDEQYDLEGISNEFDLSKFMNHLVLLNDTKELKSNTSANGRFPDGCIEDTDDGEIDYAYTIYTCNNFIISFCLIVLYLM